MISKFIIYGLADPATDAVRYIGRSSNGLVRPRGHFKPSSLESTIEKMRAARRAWHARQLRDVK